MANTQINITENGTTTLATVGCICDKNIDINVNVAVSGGNSSAEENLIALISNRDSLTSITIPDGIESIEAQAFRLCPNLEIDSLPDTVTTIQSYAFANCDKLNLTKLPDNLKTIRGYAFQNCVGLTLSKLPESLTTIDTYAFAGSAITIKEIPASVTSIAMNAFQGCKNLTEITFKGKPTTLHAKTFQQSTNLTTINVPWAEGEVAGAPWGAPNATVVYNYNA